LRIHYLQHVPFEGLGTMEKWIRNRKHELSCTRLFIGETLPQLTAFDFLVIMGGPMGIYDVEEYPWLNDEKTFIKTSICAGKIVLGICLGAQLMAEALGAEISKNTDKEIGWFPIKKSAQLAASDYSFLLPDELDVFHWHGDTFAIPEGAIRLAGSEACKNQGFLSGDRVLGLQFHLESTVDGVQELIHHCLTEEIETHYRQTARMMLADRNKFDAIKPVMNGILDYLDSIFNEL